MVIKIAIIGGGLVGSMAACFLAKRGFEIEVYEMREDPRKLKWVQGKSINLALSERGRSALRALQLEDQIIENYAIPMRARLIHDLNGKRRAIPYGNKNQFIMSVGRRYLNELMLTEAEKHQNVTLNFGHKLVACNFDEGLVTLTKPENNQKMVQKKFDLIIGCDGAYSAVRRAMQKLVRFDYDQKYIEHGYIELNIPPNENDQFAMEMNYLHIWPRQTFMLIALPNLDKSYTVTLFMPFRQFESIQTQHQLIHFFQTYFPDSIPLIGRESLITTFFNTPPSPLISIKCAPYHYRNKVLLMGDAAHAMVPFYGQGMNCGFEDCLVLDELLSMFHNDFNKVLNSFTEHRVEDCHAIVDLAMYNYIEMRNLVNSRKFLLRKKFDNLMYWLMPKTWIPLYTMVTFTRTPYRKCIEGKKWQDKVLDKLKKIASMGFVMALALNIYHMGISNLGINSVIQNTVN